MRIWHISDTHEYHNWFDIPENIDIAIHSGDAANSRTPRKNAPKMKEFMEWFSKVPAKHRIMVPGNHDVSIEEGYFDEVDFLELGIHLLHNKEIELEGLKFWGSGHCPIYGRWAYMLPNEQLLEVWKNIPTDTDVLITHTPPRYILDQTHNHSGEIEFCGCQHLMTRVYEVEPKLHLFGHIHNSNEIQNTGTKTIPTLKTLFSNGSCCVDRQFGKVFHPGNIITI